MYRPSDDEHHSKSTGLEEWLSELSVSSGVNTTSLGINTHAAVSMSSMHTGLSRASSLDSTSSDSELSISQKEEGNKPSSLRSKGPYETRRQPSQRPVMRKQNSQLAQEPEKIRIWSAGAEPEPRDLTFWDPYTPETRNSSAVAVENGQSALKMGNSPAFPNPHSPFERSNSQAVPSSIWLHSPIKATGSELSAADVMSKELAIPSTKSLAVPETVFGFGPRVGECSPILLLSAPVPPNTPQDFSFAGTPNANANANAEANNLNLWTLDLTELERRIASIRSPKAPIAQVSPAFSYRNISAQPSLSENSLPRAPPSTPILPSSALQTPAKDLSTKWYLQLIRNPALRLLTGKYGSEYATSRMKQCSTASEEFSSENIRAAFKAKSLTGNRARRTHRVDSAEVGKVVSRKWNGGRKLTKRSWA